MWKNAVVEKVVMRSRIGKTTWMRGSGGSRVTTLRGLSLPCDAPFFVDSEPCWMEVWRGVLEELELGAWEHSFADWSLELGLGRCCITSGTSYIITSCIVQPQPP